MPFDGEDFRPLAGAILERVQSTLRYLSGEPEHAALVEELEGILREIERELRRLTYLS
jgi:hypothetical protein